MRTPRLPLGLLLATALPLALVLAEVSGIVVVRHAEKADDGTGDAGMDVIVSRYGAAVEAPAGSPVE